MEKSKAIDFETLKQISGGAWDRDTLTKEERTKYDRLWATCVTEQTPEAYQAYERYCGSLDRKYGPGTPKR